MNTNITLRLKNSTYLKPGLRSMLTFGAGIKVLPANSWNFLIATSGRALTTFISSDHSINTTEMPAMKSLSVVYTFICTKRLNLLMVKSTISSLYTIKPFRNANCLYPLPYYREKIPTKKYFY